MIALSPSSAAKTNILVPPSSSTEWASEPEMMGKCRPRNCSSWYFPTTCLVCSLPAIMCVEAYFVEFTSSNPSSSPSVSRDSKSPSSQKGVLGPVSPQLGWAAKAYPPWRLISLQISSGNIPEGISFRMPMPKMWAEGEDPTSSAKKTKRFRPYLPTRSLASLDALTVLCSAIAMKSNPKFREARAISRGVLAPWE